MSVAVETRSSTSEKGRRYITSLDQALCSANWGEIVELTRKVEKHAPDRKCFTMTARLEAEVAQSAYRPTSSASTTGTTTVHSLTEAVPQLKAAIAESQRSPGDVYAAKTCLAEIKWLQKDFPGALKTLQERPSQALAKDSPDALGWIEVCEAKGAFLRADILESGNKEQDLRVLYHSATNHTPGARSLELRRWTERLLARACAYHFQRTDPTNLESLGLALPAFRAWAAFWDRAPAGGDLREASTSHLDLPRRSIWQKYHQLLSVILQRGITNNPSTTPGNILLVDPAGDTLSARYTNAKMRQRAELQRVESTYETSVLHDKKFPKASQHNPEIEEWVERTANNYEVLLGSQWTDEELGDGGKEGLRRGFLDILYRAATRTYHSTAILRRLFTTHAAVGDFDLAMHAFHSYADIFSQGKARIEKTGKREPDFDSDDTALLTAAEAVRVLCRFGDRDQAERATEVSKTIRSWLREPEPDSPEDAKRVSNDNDPAAKTLPDPAPPASKLLPSTLSTAFRAIGVSQAHWARFTHEPDQRSALQNSAIAALRKAQEYDAASIETAYALARTLAEKRNVTAAMDVIKRCISKVTSAEEEEENEADEIAKQRQLIPLWHLLALCLTARDEPETAMRMCEAAFDQFDDETTLFGRPLPADPNQPESDSFPRSSRGLVDSMDSYEKEVILQIKVTQMSLREMTEGPSVAVDLTEELLQLYARLYGRSLGMPLVKKPSTGVSAAPSTVGTTTTAATTAAASTPSAPSRAMGTLRSITGSIKPRSRAGAAEKNARRTSVVPAGISTKRGDRSSIASSIAISPQHPPPSTTHESRLPQFHLPFKHRSSQNFTAEEMEKAFDQGLQDAPPVPSVAPAESLNSHGDESEGQPAEVSSPIGNAISADHPTSPTTQPAKPVTSSFNKETLSLGVSKPGDTFSSAARSVRSGISESRVSPRRERQHSAGLLVQVWIFIAGLYARADLLDDAEGALKEAARLVEECEAEKSQDHSSARSFYAIEWATKSSVDGLWADVYAAKGEMASLRQKPFQAMVLFEKALAYWPDHARAIIHLSDLLMDVAEQKLPAEEPRPLLDALASTPGSAVQPGAVAPLLALPGATAGSSLVKAPTVEPPVGAAKELTAAEVNRLASRDRAYMLLSTLTRLGTGWDNAEAWLTLARSHELCRQFEKAKQALWWVVELEDNKPMRPWKDVTPGGYTL